jgi:para-nitrobenzyl esterase
MKRILLSLLVLINFTMSAQCDDRYSEEVFDEVSVSTVTYSDVHNLQMDIYQAVGDTETQRPLIILAHGGSFVTGIRTNPSMVALGNAFAKRGYVVASISYRLMSFLDLLSAEGALNGVARALSDGRAAVRYFRKTVDLEANPYGIDENQIYFGGNSAGGVIAVHAAFMQEEDITDPALLAALEALGGIEGDSGNDGYSSDVRGAISLAGAVADVDFITLSENNKLLISCHGDGDDVVPYSCGQPLGSAILPELCGGGAMFAHTESIGFTNHQHLLYPGQGHVPWEYGGETQDEMIDFVSDNLYAALDCMNIGCTDSLYVEYDPSANTDDGSCLTLAPVLGCTDSLYVEYDSLASEDDGSCVTLVLLGCTDSLYVEYDPSANTDDGSCLTLAPVLGCTDSLYVEYDSLANTDDGSCVTLVVLGIEEHTTEDINVYPNPTKGLFTFDVNKTISVVEVYNLNGAKLLRLENTNSVNIQHLPKGVYMVELTTVNQQKSFARVVKM